MNNFVFSKSALASIKLYIKDLENTENRVTSVIYPGEKVLNRNSLLYSSREKAITNRAGDVFYKIHLKRSARKIKGFYPVTSVTLEEV